MRNLHRLVGALIFMWYVGLSPNRVANMCDNLHIDRKLEMTFNAPTNVGKPATSNIACGIAREMQKIQSSSLPK